MEESFDLAEVKKQLGNDALIDKNYELAITLYTEAIALNPQNAIYFCNRSNAYAQLSQWDNSLADATSSLTIDGSYIKAIYRLASAQKALQKFEECRQSIQNGLTLDPTNEDFKKLLVLVKKKEKLIRQKARVHDESISSKPSTDNIEVADVTDKSMVDSSRAANRSIPPGALCHAFHCNKTAKYICEPCGTVFYCTPEHKKLHASNHNGYCTEFTNRLFHDLFGNNQFAKTICTMIHKGQHNENITNFPILSKDGSLSFLFCGASTRYETEQNYTQLFNHLKQTVFPELQKLHVTLVGHELSSNDNKVKGNVTIQTYRGGAENIPVSKLQSYQLAIIITPGLSELKYFNMWIPAINKLLDISIVTFVTCYSHYDRDTNDALFDEPTLRTYFGANIILPLTSNIWFEDGYRSNVMGMKNSRYFAFQGRNTTTTTLSKPDFIKWLTIEYMKFQGNEYKDFQDEPTYGRNCLKIALDFESGRRKYTGQTVRDLIQEANGMYGGGGGGGSSSNNNNMYGENFEEEMMKMLSEFGYGNMKKSGRGGFEFSK